ncbi:hypothetical protein NDU88_005735 [Pleurodeles waltl]|uniref:Uncharacterized protein n=1 Tax=Pleurodeles waltl TaxID=8319 RepID=A0AAV7PGA1_PLEWA|nr:hypothetical protein NDU88_005735 [Pleurodeles waltl]
MFELGAWPARWPTSSTRGVFPAPDLESSVMLMPWASANLADGSCSTLEQGGSEESTSSRSKGVAIAPKGSACDRDQPKMNNESQMAAKLGMVMRNLHFVDVWREMYPTSRIFSCYTFTHEAYGCLDRFLLANDGSLDVRRVAYQVRFLSDHTPLLLECVTHLPKPAIPLWCRQPDLMGDQEYKKDIQGDLNGYFSTNWGTATARDSEWEALKVVIRGESLSKTYDIRKRLDQELTQQEDGLAALQRQIVNGDASESDCLVVCGRIVELWDRLDNYVCRNYRQQLYREGDRLGVCWFGFSCGSILFPSSRFSVVLLEKRFWDSYG